jgi:hypothetical protein
MDSDSFNRNPSLRDVSWILELQQFGQLDLDPPYQRRSVWTTSEKKQFLDTVFNNYPSPAIFLHKAFDERDRAIYHVVDGKQRLTSILEFVNNDLSLPAEIGDNRLANKKWDDLSDNATQKRIFWNYQIAVELINDVSEPVIKEIFERLNRNSRKLQRQEMRHARFDGWLITFVESSAETGPWRALKVSTDARAKRMLDVQLLSELAAVQIYGKIFGFDQDHLDNFYVQFDDPENDDPEFDPRDFEDNFTGRAQHLLRISEHSPKLQKFVSANVHLYPLWALLVLDLDESTYDEAQFAARYVEFMTSVELARHVSGGGATEIEEPSVVRYAAASTGASTDLAKRRERYEALREYMTRFIG